MCAQKLDTQIRQEQIGQAALTLVAEKGVKNLTMAAIARRVGLVPSALYRHFKSKEEVLDAIILLIQEKLLGNVEAVRNESTDPITLLRSLLRRHVGLIRDNQAIPRIIFSDQVYSGRSGRKIKMYRVLASYLHEVGEIIRQGQKEGKIRSAGKPETIALMFVGLVVPGAILWHASDGQFDVTRQVEKAWKVFHDTVLRP